jgi:hypothetical protein
MPKSCYPTGVLLSVLAACANAEEPSAARSIMFEGNAGDREYLTTLPEERPLDRGDRCMKMLQEVERLKGKPQRRSTAMQRYRQECELQ